LIRSLTQREDVTSSLVCLVASQAENFAISPIWYDALSKEEAKRFMDEFHANVDPFESTLNLLRDCKIHVESWNSRIHFNI
jgi:hypothetical protein